MLALFIIAFALFTIPTTTNFFPSTLLSVSMTLLNYTQIHHPIKFHIVLAFRYIGCVRLRIMVNVIRCQFSYREYIFDLFTYSYVMRFECASEKYFNFNCLFLFIYYFDKYYDLIVAAIFICIQSSCMFLFIYIIIILQCFSSCSLNQHFFINLATITTEPKLNTGVLRVNLSRERKNENCQC